MPRGGRRRGSGRKKGQTIKRTQAIVEAARAGGISPLEYMLEVLRSSDAEAHRRDAMACASAPFIHPKLSATATVDGTNGAGYIGSITIVGVPRGAQYDSATGLIRYPDGLEITPPPFEPIAPTPGVDALPALPAPVEPAPAGEPLPVIEPEPDDKLAVLASYRRKRDGDDGPT